MSHHGHGRRRVEKTLYPNYVLGKAMSRISRPSLRSILATGSLYLAFALLIYEGVGLVHEPYAHLLSSNDRPHIERVAAALQAMPGTDFYQSNSSLYVPVSNRAQLRMRLVERDLLRTAAGEPVELVHPRFLNWEGRLRDPDYLQRVKVEIEATLEEYLGGDKDNVEIEMKFEFERKPPVIEPSTPDTA